MNSSIGTATVPRWVRLWSIAASAVLVFRLVEMLLRFLFVQAALLPLPWAVGNLLWNHYVEASCWLAVALAAVVALWGDTKLRVKSQRAVIVTTVALTVLALFPLRMSTTLKAHGAMPSPLDYAIRRKLPLETIDRLLERYPHLVQGTAQRTPDGVYCTYPLVSAAYQERTNLVQLLIRHHANVDVAVHELISLENTNALNLLLDCAKSEKQPASSNVHP